MLKKIYIPKMHRKQLDRILRPYNMINYCFSSGQIPVRSGKQSNRCRWNCRPEAEQVMKISGAILEKAGAEYASVLKTTCFLSDMNDFAAFNEVYAKYFTEKPARSCVAVKTLPKNVLCEVEVIAVVE